MSIISTLVPSDVQNRARPLVQRELDLLATVSEWAKAASLKCHICGLQGEKRRLRSLYRKARNRVDYMEHSPIDLLDLELRAKSGVPNTIDINAMVDCKASMEGTIKKLWVIYDECHQIANEMITSKLKPYSCFLYEYAGCIWKILCDLQRAYKEYDKSGWDYTLISRYQVGNYNVHDEYEDVEESQGYSDK